MERKEGRKGKKKGEKGRGGRRGRRGEEKYNNYIGQISYVMVPKKKKAAARNILAPELIGKCDHESVDATASFDISCDWGTMNW